MNSKVTISLLVLYLASPQGATLRCRCIKTEPNFIHPKFIDNIIIIPSGPHCPKAAIM
uniref:Interleukin-8 n=1 Tax=Callorhinchus milii TaxID=7868 RepID=V9LKR3_CALMI